MEAYSSSVGGASVSAQKNCPLGQDDIFELSSPDTL